MRIRRQLAASPGLVGYSLLAELGAKTFWTVSIWEDEAALRAFAAAEPHRSVMRRVAGADGRERVPDVHVTGREFPLTWPASKDRLS